MALYIPSTWFPDDEYTEDHANNKQLFEVQRCVGIVPRALEQALTMSGLDRNAFSLELLAKEVEIL